MRLLTSALLLLSVLFLAHAFPHPLQHNLHSKFQAMEKKAIENGYTMPKAQFFDQVLDHFDHQNSQTWKQRYFVNDTFWSGPTGPIFFQIGGEGAINAGYVVTLEMAVYAQQHGALQIALEHRFYGESRPLPSLSTENLSLLSAEQGLADAAYFISQIKKQYNAPDAPVISFGGSYPGALTAWFRLKYPTITVGAVASSAPVQATLDFYEYLDVVDQSLSYFTGPQCDSLIQNATTQIQNMLQSESGKQSVEKLFNTCTPLDTKNDITTFMSDLMGNWMGTVQYNDENGNPITIDYLCGIMINGSNDPLAAYVNVSRVFNNQTCVSVSYEEMILELKETVQIPFGVGDRQWTYQTCTEFGYFQTTDSPSSAQPFGDLVPLQYSIDMCRDIFGTTYNTDALINQTLIEYGGADPLALAYGPTNILFVNGNIDPWHSLSVYHNVSSSVTAILINGTAHCADMFPPTSIDPPGLAVAQQQITKQIGIWLDAYYSYFSN
eukprot:TRINITY_DN2135_c0_g3_i1.p1 TRINITY_DN2135_c0_g3~~TRINITY_DN2135_c0_g3_i1.p1  ORF type:complete len:502 (-),score=81.08 TRINITY_DN2135_c0_g3_i1:13-1497(-)